MKTGGYPPISDLPTWVMCQACWGHYIICSQCFYAVGVSLVLRGEVLPNDSFVDLDDIMYTASSEALSDVPSNRNPRSTEALTCVTDLVDCCGTESGTMRAMRGDWYFPDGSRVEIGGSAPAFQANRGPMRK